MLTWGKKATYAALGVLASGVCAASVAPAAMGQENATSGAECEVGTCYVEATVPGKGQETQPVVGEDGKSPKRANFCEVNTPGDQEWKTPYNCDTNYDPVNDCIWTMMSPQPPPPADKDATRGAWEQCNPTSGMSAFAQPLDTRWMDSTQAGAGQARQAAQTVVAEMQLEGIEIGMVPYSVEEEGFGAVGLPAWLWVENTDNPRAWGPYTVTEGASGVEVTATARPVHVTWDMGDGTQVVCNSAGTVYEDRFGRQESPTCGHTYMKMSDPLYTVTAVTTWSVEWSAAGESGVIETVTRSSQDVQIGEFHALNVRP